MMFQKLHIGFGHDEFQLDFRLRDTDLARRWISKVRAAQRLGYLIDEPNRFYGFDTPQEEQQRALTHINLQIKTINDYQKIIDREITEIDDQDTLNYLHNIFERYHGLLDQQEQNDFWRQAPISVRKALATLNTAVHRCESVVHGNRKRAVVTYYGLPKKHTLTLEDYGLMQRDWCFGTVHLCYVEIGKTLLDLSRDDDDYISDDAFLPYRYYSADFVVQFNDSDPKHTAEIERRMWKYYDQHRDFFVSRRYHRDHPALKMGIFPVADLDSDIPQHEISQQLKSRQHTKKVWFS